MTDYITIICVVVILALIIVIYNLLSQPPRYKGDTEALTAWQDYEQNRTDNCLKCLDRHGYAESNRSPSALAQCHDCKPIPRIEVN